jgi:probable F420-dependent oxidoreductase
MRTYADGNPTISLRLQNYALSAFDWDRLVRRAVVAEEAGFDRVLVADHLVLGEGLENYEGGTFPTSPSAPWLEPLTSLAVIAGKTERVRLGTHILQAALRRPVLLAKTAATLDVLSGGRLELGVGAGWQREEFASVGLDFTKRGRALDETLDLCRRLWTEGPVDYRSDDYTLDRIWCEPKPAQAGGVPIWVAGRLSKRMLERLVRYGQGWIPWVDHMSDVTKGIEVIREAFLAAGRDWDRFEVRDVLPLTRRDDGHIDLDATMANVRAHVDAGVTDFVVGLDFPAADDSLDELPPLVQAFRGAVGRT